MTCETCSKEISMEESLEVGNKRYCVDCFYRVAQPFRENLTPEQRQRLKDLVRNEMEGILPRDVLRGVVEDGFNRILSEKADPEEEISHIVNQIEQICGLSMSREVLLIIQALKGTLEQQEEQIRGKVRELGKL